MADPTTMLSICDPIHIVLVKTNSAGDTSLISSHFLEWRPVLTANTGRLTTSLELKGTGEVIYPLTCFVVYVEVISGFHDFN